MGSFQSSSLTTLQLRLVSILKYQKNQPNSIKYTLAKVVVGDDDDDDITYAVDLASEELSQCQALNRKYSFNTLTESVLSLQNIFCPQFIHGIPSLDKLHQFINAQLKLLDLYCCTVEKYKGINRYAEQAILNLSLVDILCQKGEKKRDAISRFNSSFKRLKRYYGQKGYFKLEQIECFRLLIGEFHGSEYKSGSQLMDESLKIALNDCGPKSIKTQLIQTIITIFKQRCRLKTPHDMLLQRAIKDANIWDFEKMEQFLTELARMSSINKDKKLFLLKAFAQIYGSNGLSKVQSYVRCLIVLCLLDEKLKDHQNAFRGEDLILIGTGPEVSFIQRASSAPIIRENFCLFERLSH